MRFAGFGLLFSEDTIALPLAFQVQRTEGGDRFYMLIVLFFALAIIMEETE